jgi:hypothetical protein
MAVKPFTPSKLITAIRSGLLDEVIAAIAAGADIEEPDMHGFVGLPLRTACFAGEIAIVRELLNRGADINAVASDGPGAPLRLAQRGKHQEIIALLLAHGAESMLATAPATPATAPIEALPLRIWRESIDTNQRQQPTATIASEAVDASARRSSRPACRPAWPGCRN